MFDHDFPFDPTYGYDQAALLTITPPPAPLQFEDFWQSHFHQAVQIRPRIERRPCPIFTTPTLQVEEIAFDALGLDGAAPFRVGGWLLQPVGTKPTRIEVIGHGYGGRAEPGVKPESSPPQPPDPVIRLLPCLRGFHRSSHPDLPSTSAFHVLHGIERRETYLHLGCAADLWAAVSAAEALFPDLAHRIDYTGGSFGGGIGALAMPWDPRVRRVHLDVPSFGHHPLRLTMPCRGSGEAVRLYHQKKADVLPVLRYFDAATAASYLQQPTLVSAARFDPAVPPPGQVAVYNAIPGTKQLLMRDGGHFTYPHLPQDEARRAEAIQAWFEKA